MYDLRQRFPKEYLDRIDVLSIDGRVVDAAGWNVQQSIWQPGMKLVYDDVDIGSRLGNRYLGPGWTVEQREPTGDVTFVRAVTRRAVVFASLPAGAAEVVLRVSAPAAGGPRSTLIEVDGRPAAQLTASGPGGYRDVVINVPADPARPSVSQLTLIFDAEGRQDFIFKLDRLTVR